MYGCLVFLASRQWRIFGSFFPLIRFVTCLLIKAVDKDTRDRDMIGLLTETFVIELFVQLRLQGYQCTYDNPKAIDFTNIGYFTTKKLPFLCKFYKF